MIDQDEARKILLQILKPLSVIINFACAIIFYVITDMVLLPFGITILVAIINHSVGYLHGQQSEKNTRTKE